MEGQSGTALFRAISPHQPPSGKIYSSSVTNDLARITHPFAQIYLKEFNLCGTYPLVWLRHRAGQILYVARVTLEDECILPEGG